MSGIRPIERGHIWDWPARLDLANVPTEWLYADLSFHISLHKKPNQMRRVWTFKRADPEDLLAEIERRGGRADWWDEAVKR